MLTLQALMYNEGNDRTGGSIWSYATGPWHPGKGARVLIALSNSTAGKCTLMQVLKKQNMEELQQPRNKTDLPFRQAMINS